ncbi:MATE family efflux transporter [Treponema brennaborense]|uniref:Multidrug export protein MepA n=1 Tax=Treponema brennaborense (strain DSM 12168 / CIP 105900 / DD5/3) TaxID=906968 RepID=F4LLC7_TREBD|nr:MATE family efflux transporter [Treponema brennaborense]AEE15605.1 multi antimicrobial extrusion protein MatE [Treponema brennaborense DSM 12168]
MNSLNVAAIQAHKTGTIMQFSLPAVIGMLLTSFITIADGFFMGNFIGKEAIAAVNLGLPIIYLFLATGLMISVGGSVIAGIALGSRNLERCRAVFNQTMATVTVCLVGLSAVVLFCFDPMLRVLGAEGAVAVHFKAYYLIMLVELPLMILNSLFSMFIRNEGHPLYSMGVMILVVVLNIALDYVFVGPCRFGVRGIAFASLISAAAGLLCSLLFFLKKSRVFGFARFRFDRAVFRNTVFNGFSEFIGEMSMCVSMFAYNYVIMHRIGVDGVTAFTVVGYVAYLFSTIVIGFGQGISPLVSFAYGAGEKPLARSLRRRTNALIFAAGLLMILLISGTSVRFSTLFVKDPGVQSMIRTGVLIFMTNFLFCGINAVSSFYFTSIGKAKESAVISSARGLVVLLICIFTLPVFFGMNGIWLTSPVSEAITLFITIAYIAKDNRA